MPYPNKKIDENVFLDPTTEKVADGWNVFKKMKDAINNIIGARGEANGIPSLGADSKIPIEQIPDTAVNPDLESRFDKIINHSHGSTSPPAPKLGQIWHDSSDSVYKGYGDSGWQPLGGSYMSIATGDIIRTSRTITLEKGTYYLMPVGGDGSIFWNNGVVSGYQGINGKKGGATTIELDGLISTCEGGSGGVTSRVGGAINGTLVTGSELKVASATSFLGYNTHGLVPLTDIKVISSSRVATITIGVGGPQAHA